MELVLRGRGSHSSILSRPVADSSDSTSPTSPDSRTGNGHSSPPPGENSTSKETTKQRVPRPTYVPLPTPPTFPTDPHPTFNSNRSDQSNESPLALFDSSYTRGSPSSSNPALNIEPGLPVLVVDDDPLTRTLMSRVLTRLGCHVTTAENGEIALEMILGSHNLQVLTPSTDASGNLGPILEQGYEENEFTPEGKYAVVFLDNQMPVLSGIRTVQKLRELGRKDLIVGVTGK